MEFNVRPIIIEALEVRIKMNGLLVHVLVECSFLERGKLEDFISQGLDIKRASVIVLTSWWHRKIF